MEFLSFSHEGRQACVVGTSTKPTRQKGSRKENISFDNNHREQKNKNSNNKKEKHLKRFFLSEKTYNSSK